MRTWLRGKMTLLFIVCAALIAIPAIALADNVKNDVVAGGNDTTTVGTPTTVKYEIQQTGSGMLGGCDATVASPVTVNINAPAGVTASPSSLSFSSCGTQKAVAFSSNTAGDYDITVSTVDNVGDYNVTPAKFTLHVTNPPPPANDPPTLSLPANRTEEATGPNGAAVSFNATANDIVDGSITPTCDAASGDTFPLGTTTVHCTAADAHGNSSSGSFDVTVQDTTGPVLSLPANITKQATSNSQATVNFTATANDLVDGSRPVSCNPASGSLFSAGTTTVNCSSSDTRDNESTGSFTVTVNYGWTGFFSPVDNNGTYNTVKAGSAIPVKFSLAGNQGLNIFATGFPTSAKTPCNATSPQDMIEETVTAGGSSLSYDSLADRYNYVWKSDKAWGGSCRMLTVKLADGNPHTALFNFTK